MKNRFTIFLCFIAASLSAQEVDLSIFENMSMRHIGPGTMSGRVTAIDVVRDQPETIVVGTASGGIWKSVSGGITWEAMFDDAPLQSIGAIAIDPSNPDVIWAGTGEGNPRNSHTSGGGIYRSLDGGDNWSLMGLVETKTIHRIIVHKDDPNTVLVAALGSAWGPNPERGVFRTTDGGATWEKVLYNNEETGCADLIVDPRNPNKLFAAMWEFGRKPWTFNSGGDGSGLYVSHNAGKTWTMRTSDDGLPEGQIGRIGLTISEANTNVVYALVESEKTALYRSEDGGKTWGVQATKNIGNRPFYYADIFAHPKNENTLFNLYSMVSKSIDGGKTFEVILPYAGAHPDHHAFYIHPDNPNLMIDGNDGGMNISHDGGNTWEFVSNLPVGQFYHINYDMNMPYNIYGGMQDNGSWKAPAYVWHGGGIRNEDWQEISFGDGFDVVPDPSSLDHAYAMYQGGNVYRIHTGTGEMDYIQPNHPEGEQLRFNWNGAISSNPHNPNGVYFGSQFVHKSDDHGKSWKIISPDLTTNDPEKQKQAESGGLTIDATQAENFTTILCIAPDKRDENSIWVGTDDGHVQLTTDGGATWTEHSTKMKDFPKGAWIPQIEVSPHNSLEAFVVVNDYRRNNWEAYVYHTKDGGNKWNRIVTSEQVSGHALAIVQDSVEENLLFLGTENGLYVSFDKGENWNKWLNEYPSVSTIDLKIHPREHDLIIGTFGRGAYILDDIRPLRAMASNSLSSEEFTVMCAQDGYMVSYMRPRGSRFGADHLWSAPNRSSAVVVSYYIPDSVHVADAKATMYVTNAQGDTLRTLRTTPEIGINRWGWGMNEKGVHFPSRRKPDADQEPWGGPMVMPGEYTCHIAYEGETQQVKAIVHPDPRRPFNAENAQAQRAFLYEVNNTIERAEKAFSRIREGQELMSFVTKQINMADDTLLNDLKAETDSLKQVLVEFETQYMTAEDFEGYDHVTQRLNDYLWRPRSFVDAPDAVIGQNAQFAKEKAEEETERVVQEINAFFNGPWKEWRGKVEQASMTLFSDYEDL
ncbi:MAG: YCF48-related protein [Flavobacteriales bacterium]|nr:YCF48-related protein [Flavobacteriales bacterium]